MNQTVTMNQWGKSLGLRIPKRMAEKLNLQDGQKIDIELRDNTLVLKPTMSLEWLMAGQSLDTEHEPWLEGEGGGKKWGKKKAPWGGFPYTQY